MRYIVTAQANADLREQLVYLAQNDATSAATALEERIATYIETTLARSTSIGHKVPGKNVYEIWIPHTKIVIWYRLHEETLEILRFWHTARNR
jgi:plasmid stabilization system protein ParE